MRKTNIEYLDYTWNPIAMRCSKVSAGCENCWHLKMADRLKCNPVIPKEKRNAYTYTAEPYFDYLETGAVLKIKKPSRIGVQFMGDLFHCNVTDRQLEKIFSMMFDAKFPYAPRHTYYILTKRPSRMLDFLQRFMANGVGDYYDHVWFGVSVEDQITAEQRISSLLQAPVKHRWISCEPLLGPVDLWTPKYQNRDGSFTGAVTGWKKCGVDWVVCGAETGPDARPMSWKWANNLSIQCKAAGVPFFFKEPWNDAPGELKRREFPK